MGNRRGPRLQSLPDHPGAADRPTGTARGPGGLRTATRLRARRGIGRPPAFPLRHYRPIFHQIRNEVAELQLQIAGELRQAGEHDRALGHCARACALRRRIFTESRLREHYLPDFADALAYWADYLTEDGRLDAAVAVGAESATGSMNPTA
ncbi:hypothetical protein [Nocardia sp. X0981]